jgi:hypothetical protein
VIHPGQCRRLSPRWPRGEEQIVQIVTEPPIGGLIEKHAWLPRGNHAAGGTSPVASPPASVSVRPINAPEGS